MGQHTDLKFGEVSSLFIFYKVIKVFDYFFVCVRESENDLLHEDCWSAIREQRMSVNVDQLMRLVIDGQWN